MKASFAAGCFWGVEAAFKRVKGVISTKVGYTGGTKVNPTYEEVCSGDTGHTESILIEYDSKKVSYERLLYIFWQIHDPTSLDRQGNDTGSQYRAIIFYFSDEQKKIAMKSLKEQQKKYKEKIMTQILKVEKFYNAEKYHQDYLDKNKYGYCHIDLNKIK